MTTFNLSDSDRDAISFYEENLNFVNGFGLTNLEQGERRMFKKGRTLVEKVAAAARAALNPRNADATRWTAEEYDVLAAAYVKHGRDRVSIIADFRLYSDRHSDNAVTLAAYSCAALDKRCKEITGLKDYANGLLTALQALESDRFFGTR